MSDDRVNQLAETVHALVTEIATHQITREIAHLAEIEVDTATSDVPVAPEGYGTPPSGVVVTTHVLARSRDVPAATTETRVAVWVAASGEPRLVVTRSEDDKVLEIVAADLEPEPSAHLRAQVNDYVALVIAHMVTHLNVAMQRSYIRESEGDVTEYEG